MDPQENQWLSAIPNPNWRCKFYCSSVGCKSADCKYVHACLLCGAAHATALPHRRTAHEPWANPPARAPPA